jgi:hypothetical protein
MTVGMKEVERKRRHFRELELDDRTGFLARHMVPTVIGPKGRRYLIDHHHLCRALVDEGCEGAFAITVADLSMVDKRAFWTVLDHHGWVHPYDRHGQRQDFKSIPGKLEELKDDPFRSLAGAVRDAGGFAKDLTPFNEFLWADFLRGHFTRETPGAAFGDALEKAMSLARSAGARYLPGWCGHH